MAKGPFLCSANPGMHLFMETRKPYAEAAGHGRRGWCARVWSPPPPGLSKESGERWVIFPLCCADQPIAPQVDKRFQEEYGACLLIRSAADPRAGSLKAQFLLGLGFDGKVPLLGL